LRINGLQQGILNKHLIVLHDFGAKLLIFHFNQGKCLSLPKIRYNEDKVKANYLSLCEKYPFYKGRGGSASVGKVTCH
jgi:hypothetical protein